jgi:hypothetical protein
MGQVLHGGATTTAAVRRAIQHSQESLRRLAKHYGINLTTVAKWRSRNSVQDLPTGPKQAQSSPSGHHPAPDTLIAAPLLATTRHLPAARDREHRSRQAQVQDLPARLLPHRHRRGPDSPGQALSPRCHRPRHQVCLRRTAPEGNTTRRRRFPTRSRQSRTVYHPYRADRQRHARHLTREHLLSSHRHPPRHRSW